MSNGKTLGRGARIGVRLAILLLVPAFLVDGTLAGRESTQRRTDKWAPATRTPGAPVTVVEVGTPVTPGVFDGDLRDLPLARMWAPGDPIREIRHRSNPTPEQLEYEAQVLATIEPRIDPLLSLSENVPRGTSRAFGTPTVNIDSIQFTGVFPPDTVGEIGANHYIQMTNDSSSSMVAVFDKSGTLQAGPFRLSTLWNAGGACASGGGDPIVLFDQIAGRWVLSEFASAGNHLCVYVSQTSDPLAGGWFLYDFQTPNFPDYPKYAVWPDGYYVSTNENGVPGAYALQRQQMLAGQAAAFQRFTAPTLAGFGFQALTPADLDGSTAPPNGAPAYFLRHRDDEVHNSGSNNPSQDFIDIFEYDLDTGNPGNSTFTPVQQVAVSEFDSTLCGLSGTQCFPQPGTGTTLDPLREVIMWRLQYRNFGSFETLVGNFVTDVNGSNRGGIRWFVLRKQGGGNWTLQQEGTHSPNATHRWMGSIAMDGGGNIALGYSLSSSSVSPSIAYAGRLAGDPQGTLPQGEHPLVAGGGSQTGATRWGDYASMNLDPTDDCTFWYTNEYIPSGSSLWRTRIGSFRFDECQGCQMRLRLEDDEVRAGEPMRVQVHLKHNRLETVQAGFSIWIEDAAGNRIAGRDTPRRAIRKGDELDRDYSIEVPEGVEPGEYTLVVAIDRMTGGTITRRKQFWIDR